MRHNEHDPKSGQFVDASTPDELTVHVSEKGSKEPVKTAFQEIVEEAKKQVSQGADHDFQILKVHRYALNSASEILNQAKQFEVDCVDGKFEGA